ncbi:hypothetical protein [Flaviaesturariibacter amylovorans]|uniref:MORN motif-containing protein n=1 Tax=Flaviaesturariibacter amylovorans TaxID=1084520 RepID=A0ABP8GTX2_9BACT
MPASARQTLFLLFALAALQAGAQTVYKITDTVYYNARWQICEKPVASFYRAGVLAGTTDNWFFYGPVKDYTMDHHLLMEGNYSEAGRKEGPFRFYNYKGTLLNEGSFERDTIHGIWKWYYPNGKERASIYFPSGEQSFQFITYRDSTGKATLENGVGDFEWSSHPYTRSGFYFRIRGSFDKGMRQKNWQYDHMNGSKHLKYGDFGEGYAKDGGFKWSSFKTDYTRNSQNSYPVSFVSDHLRVTEQMQYDAFFALEGDSTQTALLNYLIEGRTARIHIPKKTFDSSFNTMLRLLDALSPAFGYRERDIKGTIEFKIGPAGFPEDISIQSEHTDSSEVRLLHFLMNKFRKIEMPSEGNIALEAYHKIHFYVVNLRDYFTANLRDHVDVDLIFSSLTKEQTIQRLEADKKKIKKYLRRNYSGLR